MAPPCTVQIKRVKSSDSPATTKEDLVAKFLNTSATNYYLEEMIKTESPQVF